MFKRILVPTDGSEITARAAKAAIIIAKEGGGQIFAVSVRERFAWGGITEMNAVPLKEFHETQERIAQERVAVVAAAAKEHGVPCQTFTVDTLHPWEAILSIAKENNCDLIAMASHGRRGVAALLIGSETQRVLTHSDISVLVVK